jgi:hypothetical protein
MLAVPASSVACTPLVSHSDHRLCICVCCVVGRVVGRVSCSRGGDGAPFSASARLGLGPGGASASELPLLRSGACSPRVLVCVGCTDACVGAVCLCACSSPMRLSQPCPPRPPPPPPASLYPLTRLALSRSLGLVLVLVPASPGPSAATAAPVKDDDAEVAAEAARLTAFVASLEVGAHVDVLDSVNRW